MKRARSRAPLVFPPLSTTLATLSTTALLATACTSASIQSPGGDGGSGGGGNPGEGSGGLVINISGPSAGSGGTTGSTLVCNSTSTAGCKAQYPDGCGDGINNQGGIEDCDDGNVLPGDGCNGACKVEPHWECPPAGKCTRLVVCGDRQIGAGEVCDDGNTKDDDGCDATCTVQDPAFTCVPGEPCVRTSECGNRRIEAGETCDDGNTQNSDGCSLTCHLEGGWVCPNPGQPCKEAPRCGDKVMQPTLGEVCDDGNQQDGDGCSADCRTKGTGCVCNPGELCQCPEVECGNGILEGSEKCDDGNTESGDGCAKDCTVVEKGFQCRVVGKACTPKCGDGVKSGSEICDDGNTASGDGCSATCKLELGWKCDDSGKCISTTCGDGKVEGAEGCDVGDNLPFDGCSMDCQWEPDCKGESCTSKCGDGIVLNEDCDDGNAGAGDGCTKDCKVEPGWTCEQPEIGDRMEVPAVYRDFHFSTQQSPNDFEGGVTGQDAAATGMVNEDLDANGKPVYASPASPPGNVHVLSPDTFAQWFTDVAGVNHATAGKLALWRNAEGAYVNRYGPNGEQWDITENAYWCGTVGQEMTDPDTGDPIPCTFAQGTTDCDRMDAEGHTQLRCFVKDETYQALYSVGKVDGNPLFFPVDMDDFSAGEMTGAQIPSRPVGMYDASGTWPWHLDDAGNKIPHNFSFTSEVKYWFKYDSSKSYTLSFVGDDDVWVFINKKLALDIGGIHTPVEDSVILDAAAAARFGNMKSGNVYQIAVFQAERQSTCSSYKLTLSGFNAAPTECVPTCGDGKLVGDEECDCGDGTVPVPAGCAGPNDAPAYNGCGANCKWGPFCGDGETTDPEECDNGVNNDDYGAANGCAPGCKLPPRCGDSVLQTAFDEECDDGPENVATSDPNEAYGGCMSNCKRGGRCGDGITNGDEPCDDGVNDGTYGTCGLGCTPAPRCGDGIVQDDYGEECEPAMSNDPDCSSACRKPFGCGDGIVQEPEECDVGALANNGEYGGCAPSCILAPHCKDGVVNGPEECDDGKLDGTYGGCTPQCKLAPHCGDGMLNGDEQCDHGRDNGRDGLCSESCKSIIYTPP